MRPSLHDVDGELYIFGVDRKKIYRRFQNVNVQERSRIIFLKLNKILPYLSIENCADRGASSIFIRNLSRSYFFVGTNFQIGTFFW